MKAKSLHLATIVFLAVFFAAVMPFSAYLLSGFYRSYSSITGSLADAVQAVSIFERDDKQPIIPVTFLVYGIDAGEWIGGRYRAGTGRADTIVLLKVSPATNSASLLSIPRDTLVEIPGRPGDDKINHAYAFGGAELLVKTVELFTGVPVDYYVGLNYRAFKDIVDILGGVEFDVDRVIEGSGIRLEPGLQRLDGDQAFTLVTFRREAMGDIARVRRQQRFIKAVGNEAGDRPIDELFYIMLAAWKNIETDVELMDAISFAWSSRRITEEDVVMGIVPGWFYNRGGVSYWGPYLEETSRLVNDLFSQNGDED